MDNNASSARILSTFCTLALLVTLAACVGPDGPLLFGSTMGGTGSFTVTGPDQPWLGWGVPEATEQGIRVQDEWAFDDTSGVFGGMRIWRSAERPYSMSAGDSGHEYTDSSWGVSASFPDYAGAGVYGDGEASLHLSQTNAVDWDDQDVEYGGEEFRIVSAEACHGEVFDGELSGFVECAEVRFSSAGVERDDVFTVRVEWQSDATPYQEPEFASE